MSESLPKYIKGASFIEPEVEIDEEWWPRNPYEYSPTAKWKTRVRRLKGIVSTGDITDAIQHGDGYRAANNNIAFIKDLGGLVIYVVVDAELLKVNGEYPTEPDKADYRFKGVTVWPYLYDQEKALDTGRWSSSQLEEVKEICKEAQNQ